MFGVDVATHAHVVDAGDLADVIHVVGHVADGGGRVRMLLEPPLHRRVDLDGVAELVPQSPRLDPALGVQRRALGREERRHERHHHDGAGASSELEHVVGHVARHVAERTCR